MVYFLVTIAIKLTGSSRSSGADGNVVTNDDWYTPDYNSYDDAEYVAYHTDDAGDDFYNNDGYRLRYRFRGRGRARW